jgi:4-alpha-glucanotransferase
MSGVRLIFALHNHQPVGNFDGVFEAAYRDSYKPFLDVMEDYPDIPFVLHTSGSLLEWLAEHKPEYVGRVRAMAEAGRVEILGGGFFEPILTMIPYRDRVGQVRDYAAYLTDLFGAPVRGMWVPERVWEQHLVSALVEAGVEYTVLDDFHFQRAGLTDRELTGYYLTEDEGHLLKVFPSSERLRYIVPFHEPHAAYEYLRRLADEQPGATVVCADDGEKFGSWPETYDHVFTHGWLRRFCDMLQANRSWIRPTTFAEAVDSTLPLGKVYLPDGSYREMTEWALPPARQIELKDAVKGAEGHPAAERLKPFVRLGGFWRNFKTKYAESDEMYTRMLGVSNRLAAAESNPDADPDYLEAARQDLYRGQCNCPYWHGSFGGLYLPHLRNAIYRHLISAHNAIDDAEGLTGPRVSLEVADFNLDARQEARLENDHLIAFVRPASGGHVYELDVRPALTNVLNTLDRRPEPYHRAIVAATTPALDRPVFSPDRVILKHDGLDQRLVYDRYPRKALVDHFLPLDVTLDELVACRDVELGDFVQGAYLSKVHRGAERVGLVMERIGRADGHAIRIRKSIELAAGSAALEVVYILDDLPEGVPLHFAVEVNIAAMAGHADDRYYSDATGKRLGMLDSRLDLPEQAGATLTDEWLDLRVGLEWSRPAGLWCLPVETVSQSEGGFEAVYQSSAVIPHWFITADSSRQWRVRLRWTVGRASGPTEEMPDARGRLVEIAAD